jgi:hypothetical protein
MKTKFLMAVLGCMAAVVPLHAGFIGTVCYDVPQTCVGSNTLTSVTSGSTTYTFDGQFTGGLVGGKPTLGTFAQMTVDDPNGVPTLASGMPVSANMTFADTVAAAPAPFYSFNIGLHVINGSNNFQNGFYEVTTAFVLNVVAKNALNVQQWATSNVSFPHVNVNFPGNTTLDLTYTTPLGFPNTDVSKLEISMSLTSTVWYANNPHMTNATHVSASSDASHTFTLDSIEALDDDSSPLPATFTSSAGANYSTGSAAVPEPASGVLVLLGLGAAGWRKGWLRRRL